VDSQPCSQAHILVLNQPVFQLHNPLVSPVVTQLLNRPQDLLVNLLRFRLLNLLPNLLLSPQLSHLGSQLVTLPPFLLNPVLCRNGSLDMKMKCIIGLWESMKGSISCCTETCFSDRRQYTADVQVGIYSQTVEI
jgi:hypothetical protein